MSDNDDKAAVIGIRSDGIIISRINHTIIPSSEVEMSLRENYSGI